MNSNGSTCFGWLRAANSMLHVATGTTCIARLRPANFIRAFLAMRSFRRWPTTVLSALGLTAMAPPSIALAQAPPLGTLANFAILAGAGITNTGPSVITGIPTLPGDLGSTTASIGGFPPGIVVPPGIIHSINDGPTMLAQASLVTAYNNLAVACEQQGLIDRARSAYENAVARAPRDVLIRQNYELFKELHARSTGGVSR
mgnify:CR=1 FL=1